jgi:hypothetical protein
VHLVSPAPGSGSLDEAAGREPLEPVERERRRRSNGARVEEVGAFVSLVQVMHHGFSERKHVAPFDVVRE